MEAISDWYDEQSGRGSLPIQNSGTNTNTLKPKDSYYTYCTPTPKGRVYVIHKFTNFVGNKTSNIEDPFDLLVNTFEFIHQHVESPTPKTCSLTELSKDLMVEFGFKKANWAKVLKVERKTLYNWENSPETKVQYATEQRLDSLSKFKEIMDEDQRKYLSLFTFGRRSDPKLLKALTAEVIDVSELEEHYFRLYNEFQGFSVRSKMGLE